jgi:hypothetical protein
VKLLFVGDSITDFWLLHDSPWVQGQKFGGDITHPNEAGYRVWRERLLKALDAARAIERTPGPCST